MGIDGFMFHDMLYWHTALLGHPGSSLVYATHFNPIYPKLTALYNSPLSFCTSSLSQLILLFLSPSTSLFIFVCRRLLFRLHPPLSLSPPPDSLLRAETRRSPCAPRRCGSCLNGTALIFACMASTSSLHYAGEKLRSSLGAPDQKDRLYFFFFPACNGGLNTCYQAHYSLCLYA